MTQLENNIQKYYTQGYNCSETLLRACNETYQLEINEEDLRCMAGFGGGMFIGSTCGALVGCIAALSKMVCPTKAHDCPTQPKLQSPAWSARLCSCKACLS